MNMNRRELLQQAALLMGGAISAPAILGVLNGCSAKKEVGWKPQFLSEAQAALVTDVVEIIIPRTDTPGAQDVGVPAFIDTMLKEVYTQEDRDRYTSGLEAFDSAAEAEHGKPFLKLDQAQRVALVQKFNDEAVAAERAMDPPPKTLRRPFILMTKELTLLGFFSSQAGAAQVLQYVAVPGAFKGCVPLKEAGNGRTWAGETSLRF